MTTSEEPKPELKPEPQVQIKIDPKPIPVLHFRKSYIYEIANRIVMAMNSQDQQKQKQKQISYKFTIDTPVKMEFNRYLSKKSGPANPSKNPELRLPTKSINEDIIMTLSLIDQSGNAICSERGIFTNADFNESYSENNFENWITSSIEKLLQHHVSTGGTLLETAEKPYY